MLRLRIGIVGVLAIAFAFSNSAFPQDKSPDPTTATWFYVEAVEPSSVAWLGLETVEPVDASLRSHLNLSEDVGLAVIKVQKESPADKAGIKMNDILIHIGGRNVNSLASLGQALEGLDGRVPAMIYRHGKKMDVAITLTDSENLWVTVSDGLSHWLGVCVSKPSEVMSRQLRLPPEIGLVVDVVFPGSPADGVIKEFDILLEIDGNPITDADSFRAMVHKLGARESSVRLKMIRHGKNLIVTVKPAAKPAETVSFIRTKDLGVSSIEFEKPLWLDAHVQSISEVEKLAREVRELSRRIEQLESSAK